MTNPKIAVEMLRELADMIERREADALSITRMARNRMKDEEAYEGGPLIRTIDGIETVFRLEIIAGTPQVSPSG